MFRQVTLLCLQVLLWLCVSAGHASANMVLPPGFDYAKTGNKLEYLMEQRGLLDLNQVKTSDRWQAMEKIYPSFGFTNKALWLRLTLTNTGDSRPYVVRLEYPLLDHVEFYQPGPNNYIMTRGGDQLPFRERVLKDRYFSYPVELEKDETKTLYWRVKSRDTLIVPVSVSTLERYQADQSFSLLFFGMYYGAIIIILLFNSFLYVFLGIIPRTTGVRHKDSKHESAAKSANKQSQHTGHTEDQSGQDRSDDCYQ